MTSERTGGLCRIASFGNTVLAAAFGVVALVAPAASGQTWTNGGSTGLWSGSTTNWSSVPSNGSARFFNDGAVGSSTADAFRTVGRLNVVNSSGTHAVDIDSGTLTVTQLEIGLNADGAMQLSNGTFSLTNASPLRLGRAEAAGAAAAGVLVGTNTLTGSMGFTSLSTVGYADGSFNASATMDMSDSDNGYLSFAGIRAGYANTTGIASADMSFGDNWTFLVGTSTSSRGEFSVGYAGSTGTAGFSFTTGTGGSFTAYTNSLNIAGGANATNKTSTVDLSGIDNGLIYHSGGSGSFNIGRGAGSGSLAVGSNWTMDWTVPAAFIGYDGGTGSVTGTNMTLQGTLSFLYVGTRDSAGSGGYGTLDMGGGSMGTGLTISSALRVGVNSASTGTVKFGSGLVAMNGTADIGDAGTSGVEGLLELHGTQFTAGSGAGVQVKVNNSGRLNIFVSDTSSGLILNRNSSAALVIDDTVANGNGILATFENNPTGFDYLGSSTSYDSIYWAIKWAGDQTSTLDSFLTAGKIDYDTSGLTGDLAGATPEVIYDSIANETYYGIYVVAVPEPGSLALAFGGMACAGFGLRRRSRKA